MVLSRTLSYFSSSVICSRSSQAQWENLCEYTQRLPYNTVFFCARRIAEMGEHFFVHFCWACGSASFFKSLHGGWGKCENIWQSNGYESSTLAVKLNEQSLNTELWINKIKIDMKKSIPIFSQQFSIKIKICLNVNSNGTLRKTQNVISSK